MEADDTPKHDLLIVLDWVIGAMTGFPRQLIRNAWTKTGHDWFDRQPDNRDDILFSNDEDDTDGEEKFVLGMWCGGEDMEGEGRSFLG